MTRYIIRRSLQSLTLLWVSTLIGFTIYQLAPGGPLQFLEKNPRTTLERSGAADQLMSRRGS
jgi:ABC-type dipeptide/oligopeptide/nickel transport system permease component